MANISPIVSDSENANEATSSGKKKALKKAGDSDVEDVEIQDADADGSDAEESEYEIEAILDAKRGTFPDGRIGYLVKWKGYGDSENSWVDELDAGNAEVLIDDYWKKNSKTKKVPRKSEPKPPKRPRKSAAREDSSEIGSTTHKKRSRKSQAKGDSDLENGKEDVDSDVTRVTKKAKKNTKAQEEVIRDSAPVDDEEEEIGNMSKYMKVASWDSLIASVDTVERVDDADTLMVYFALKTGERVKENSRICGERFPQKLLQFYETNLRWRTSDDSEEATAEA